MSSLIEYYKNLYIENRIWIKFAAVWFLVSMLIGSGIFFIKPSLLTDFLNSFQNQFGPNPALDYHLVLQIFLKNLLAVSVALFGGIIFGLAPLFVILVNGILLGFVLTSVFAMGHPINALVLIVGGIVPHGIIEIPIFFVASGLGLRLGLEWMGKNAAGNRLQILKNNFKQSFLVWIKLILLILLAAIVEVYISGRLVEMFK